MVPPSSAKTDVAASFANAGRRVNRADPNATPNTKTRQRPRTSPPDRTPTATAHHPLDNRPTLHPERHKCNH